MAQFPFNDWRAEQMRLTVFPMPTEVLRSANWWSMVVGVEPEEITFNPRTGSGLVQGPYGDAKLVLKFEADRIDWLLVPREAEEELQGEFGALGPVADALEVFS